MDASRFKRRTTQTPRHTTRPTPEAISGIAAPQAGFRRAAVVAPVQRPSAPAPVLQPLRSEAVAAPVAIPVTVAARAIAPAPQPDAPVAPVQAPVSDTPAITDAPTAPRPLLDMSLPGEQTGQASLVAFLRRGRWHAARKWALRGGLASLLLVMVVGGVLFSQGAFKLHKVFKGSAVTAAALKTNVAPDLLKGEGDGRINILLMGRGGGTHEAPDLTDTMMLMSIDPVNHTQSLVSIPRDLWVNVPNAGSMKINAVWETGEFKYLGKVAPGSTDPKAIQAGFDLADQSVESVLGVPINYNVIVDFDAFKQAITTVGGVTVNVPTDLIDPTMSADNFRSPIIAKAGINNLDAQHALNYVRSRETTSDFARSQRQRAVMLALKDKVQALGTLSNPLKISQLINAFGDNVSTDMSLNNADRLYGILSQIPNTATTSIGLADKPNNYVTTGTIAGQSVDIPTAGLGNYAAIQKYIHTQLKDGYLLKENARVMVYNGTALPGVATATSDTLKSYGYNVIGAANTPNTGWTQTTLIALNTTDKYTQHYLEQRYKVKAVTKLPDTTIAANGADFVIIIGSDEATTAAN